MSHAGGRRRFSWPSALIGAASATAAAIVIFGRPRDPTFHVISINLSSFRLNLPLLDLELTLAVHVTNPNIVPIIYSPSTVSISYRGSHLGSAQLHAGSQPPMSCQLIHLPARLDGIQMAQHVGSILADVARREMRLDATVEIGGAAKVLFMERRFSAHVGGWRRSTRRRRGAAGGGRRERGGGWRRRRGRGAAGGGARGGEGGRLEEDDGKGGRLEEEHEEGGWRRSTRRRGGAAGGGRRKRGAAGGGARGGEVGVAGGGRREGGAAGGGGGRERGGGGWRRRRGRRAAGGGA